MKNWRGKLFAALSIFSLLLAVATGLEWWRSMKREAHLISFHMAGPRYTLKSKSGQFLLMGPPIKPGEARTAELMTLASNNDLDWSERGDGLVWGVVRKFSPTWSMWQANWDLWEGVSAQPGARYSMRNIPLWLEAMEDENRFVPAHMMLTFAAGEKRNEYFRPDRMWGIRAPRTLSWSWERHDLFAGRGPGWSPPMLRLEADASGKRFDPSLRLKLRQEWHDVLDQPRLAIFHGWIIVSALVPPIVWTARPRVKQRTARRWLFNGLAIVSLMLAICATILWVRSFWVSEHWSFFARQIATPQGMSGTFVQRRHLGSGQGVIRWAESQSSEAWPQYLAWGYGDGMLSRFSSNIYTGPVTGERYLRLPGLEIHTLPLQQLAIGPAMTPIAQGRRTITISWWILVMGCALLPLLWSWGAIAWWLRARQVRLQRGKLCQVCGYDLQATAGRCPECGTVPDGELLKM